MLDRLSTCLRQVDSSLPRSSSPSPIIPSKSLQNLVSARPDGSSPELVSGACKTLVTSVRERTNAAGSLCAYCYGCRNPVRERFCLSLGDGRLWHSGCLRCHECRRLLQDQRTCFARNGKIFCKLDYQRYLQREFTNETNPCLKSVSKNCLACGEQIKLNDFIIQCPNVHQNSDDHQGFLQVDFERRFRVYHMQCFCCGLCARPLKSGDAYRIAESGPICLAHATFPSPTTDNSVVAQSSIACSLDLVTTDGTKAEALDLDVNCVEASPKRNRKKRTALHDVLNSVYEANGANFFYLNNGSRQKRMRTSFKHHQLRTMKAYFNINHNPDAKDLKTLSEKTGLSKRVLQVWFQNARAKYRRSVTGRHDTPGGQSLSSDIGIGGASSSQAESVTSIDNIASAVSEDFLDDLDASPSDAVSSSQTSSSLIGTANTGGLFNLPMLNLSSELEDVEDDSGASSIADVMDEYNQCCAPTNMTDLDDKSMLNLNFTSFEQNLKNSTDAKLLIHHEEGKV